MFRPEPKSGSYSRARRRFALVTKRLPRQKLYNLTPMPETDRHIYLDFTARTPTTPEVLDAMRMVLAEPYGNPSSGHWAGSPAREAVDKARTQVAELLGCNATEIVFTSGGSEANNHALKGVFFASGKANAHIV